MGELSSVGYSATLKSMVGMGTVRSNAPQTAEQMLASHYEIEVSGQRVSANASIRPLANRYAEPRTHIAKFVQCPKQSEQGVLNMKKNAGCRFRSKRLDPSHSRPSPRSTDHARESGGVGYRRRDARQGYLHKDKFLALPPRSGFGFCNVVFGWDAGDRFTTTPMDGLAHGVSRFAGADRPRHVSPRALGRERRFSRRVRRKRWRHTGPCLPGQLYRRVLKRAEKMGFGCSREWNTRWFNFRETSQSLADKGT